MHILIGVLAVAGAAFLVIAFVAGTIWLYSREYDRHPWFAWFLNSAATMVPGYIPPDDDITPEYRAQIPGWDAHP